MFVSNKFNVVFASCRQSSYILLALIGLFWMTPALSQATAHTTAQLTGTWRGALVAAQFEPLEVVLHIQATGNGDAYTATLDIPTQFRTDLPVDRISLKNSNILVSIPALDAEFFGSLIFDTEGLHVIALNGDWSQSGEHIPLRLERSK